MIDIPETAQRNISALLEDEGRGLALVSLGANGGLLTVTCGGELYQARQIDVALGQNMDEEHRSHAFERIALELQRSLDNFERQFPYIGVSRLLVAPFKHREEFC